MIKNKNDLKTLEDIESEFSKLYTWFVFTFIFFAMLAFGFILAIFKINKLEEKINLSTYSPQLEQVGAFYNNDIDSYVLTDLSGTSWELNDYLTINTSYEFYINCYIHSEYYNYYGSSIKLTPKIPEESPALFSVFDSSLNSYIDIYQGSWIGPTPYYLDITNGSYVTNSNLISWLQSNATQIQTTITYNITSTLTNLTASGSTTIDSGSTATITLTANSGYHLPTSIIVTNADYTYNSTTGVITLLNATDNVTITASGLQIFSVTMNLTGLSSNAPQTVVQGTNLFITLTPLSGFALPLSIIMSDSALLTNYYENTGVISYSSVTDNVVITAVGRHIYNINILVDLGINSSITDTFVEGSGDIKFYTFTCSSNYVFDSILSYSYNNNIYSYTWNDDNLISDLSGTLSNFTISHSGYEGLSIQFDNVQSDISFTINSTGGLSLANKIFILDLTLYYNSGFTMSEPLIYRVFTSNEKTFYKIIKNDLNNFEYLNQSTPDESINVFTFLTGQYLPFDTYNYQLISFDSYSNLSSNFQTISQVRDWLRADDDFFNFYRVASQTDLNNINAKNAQLVQLVNNTSFVSLFGAILDAQFGVLERMLNFNIFEINFWSIVCLFFSLTLVYFVIKFIKGGKHNDKND